MGNGQTVGQMNKTESQTQKTRYYKIPFLWISRKGKTTRTKSRSVVAWCQGLVERE